MQERAGGHRGIGYVIAARFQPLALAHVGRLAAVLAPAAVLALHGDEPFHALLYRRRDRIVVAWGGSSGKSLRSLDSDKQSSHSGCVYAHLYWFHGCTPSGP